MWCSVCQSDVATEVGADNRRVSCSNCGLVLGGAAGATTNLPAVDVAPDSGPDTRAEEARQLLDRWAKGHFLDPYGPPKKTGIAADTMVTTATGKVSVELESRHKKAGPVGSAATQETGVSAAAHSIEDTRNPETIDERTFVTSSPESDSEPEWLSMAKPSAKQAGTESTDSSSEGEVATEKVVAVNDKAQHDESKSVATSDSVSSASSAELDRLTREIMARVSQLTEARTAAVEEHSTDTVTSSVGLAASFPVPATTAPGSEYRDGNDRSTHTAPTGFNEPIPSRSEMNHRMDSTHQSARDPEPTMAAASTNETSADPVSGGWYNFVGQIFAYLGIICLTAGTCGVIVSYFGGPASYAPYGWLGATIGQMFLFLGIVILISAGMEQTSQELRQTVDQRMDEVTQRLDQIGIQVMRIEEANLNGLPKPHMLPRTDHEQSRTSRQNSNSIRNEG